MAPRKTRAHSTKNTTANQTSLKQSQSTSSETTTETSSAAAPPLSLTKSESLQPAVTNPPHLFILPTSTTSTSRILTLCNPRTSKGSRYLISPSHGLYEFTKIGPSKTIPKSLLFSPSCVTISNDADADVEIEMSSVDKGYITRSADIYLATPYDPLFLLLPVLLPPTTDSTSSSSPRHLYLSLEDHIDTLLITSPHLRSLLSTYGSLRSLFEQRLAVICDAVQAGDESMYRLSHAKLLNVILGKASAMVQGGLPRSMEEKLVCKVLEPPVLALKRGESNVIEEMEEAERRGRLEESRVLDGQSSNANGDDGEKEEGEKVAGVGSRKAKIEAPEEVVKLLRLKTAFEFIASRYLPPSLTQTLQTTLFDPPSPHDTTTTQIHNFQPLITHLSNLAHQRKQAHATRTDYESYTRKRTFEDEDAAEERRAKKARAEEEEKKKKLGASRGVKLLAKVNVQGMRKMSDFFGRKV